jgi:hypothetical protein
MNFIVYVHIPIRWLVLCYVCPHHFANSRGLHMSFPYSDAATPAGFA